MCENRVDKGFALWNPYKLPSLIGTLPYSKQKLWFAVIVGLVH